MGCTLKAGTSEVVVETGSPFVDTPPHEASTTASERKIQRVLMRCKDIGVSLGSSNEILLSVA
jgi:hypothetical protein